MWCFDLIRFQGKTHNLSAFRGMGSPWEFNIEPIAALWVALKSQTSNTERSSTLSINVLNCWLSQFIVDLRLELSGYFPQETQTNHSALLSSTLIMYFPYEDAVSFTISASHLSVKVYLCCHCPPVVEFGEVFGRVYIMRMFVTSPMWQPRLE